MPKPYPVCADNTVHTDDEFWSSTGSGSRDADDYLLYRLLCPLASVSYVSVAVYRATQQHGVYTAACMATAERIGGGARPPSTRPDPV